MLSNIPFLPSLRLLHLEDNATDAELISMQIAEEWPDCKIRLVASRDDFLAALAQEEFDLILSDFSLPAFNGLEALDLVRKTGSTTPFLFLSGTIGEDNAVEALQHGAVDYLIKDRPARLIPAMRGALQQRREHQLRRRAEQHLREQAEVLDKARDAICVTDIEGRVTYWNQSANELFGWSGDEGRGQQLQQLFGLFNQALIPDALKEVKAAGAWTKELQIAVSDGAIRHIVSRWTLVRDAENRPKSILLINTDVTEEKKLEAQLLRSQRLEGIGTLAGGIAHDLNNVLTPIIIAVNMLRENIADADSRHLLDVVEKSAQHGAGLVRQVLAFARGAEGERAEIQPKLVIQDVVTLLRETLPRAISLEMDVPGELRHVVADATQLSQVLMNLCVNARDAMAGGGRLRIAAQNVSVSEALALSNPGAHPGPHVLLTVADSGSGIPRELIDRIFDPFFTTKVAGKGTGLGLSTVMGIMKAHGGFLQVQSELGRGTEFSLFFPSVAGTVETAVAETKAELPRGHGEMVLVIDDEPAVREVVRSLLKIYGYAPVVAEDGASGIALFREQQPNVGVVVTDMMMPGIQGPEVIRELRSINPDVRVVAMSGVISERGEVSEDPGRLIFLAKPMTGAELLGAVQRVIRSTV
ncbi:MAG TPA: response regulator [Lacunisphaera sp.]|jgi:PAS domain S-box-containing protein